MAKYRHLENAPITETIIDLRVRPSTEFDINQLSYLPAALKKQYPRILPVRTAEGGFSFRNGQLKVEKPQDLGIYAYRFESEDGKQVIQFRKDGFGFSRLKPYTDWNNVVSEAKKLWQVYSKRMNLECITRVAVRYINHLSIPLPINDFADYLTAPPPVPKSVPQAVGSFLTRVVVHDIERQLDANIAQAMERSTKPDFVTIILDIDAYKLGEFDVQTDQIWTILDQLRDLKNTIFFGSITENTARLFE